MIKDRRDRGAEAQEGVMPMEKPVSELASVLQVWANLGTQLSVARLRPSADWSAVDQMIVAVQPLMKANAEKLKELLIRSGQKLAPLGEPFEFDLGLHRWLDAEREEAYSDWLEWVVLQAKTAVRVFRLFDLELPKDLPRDAELTTKREVCVAEGHPDREGRLDLVAYFGDRAVLVVEVKKGDAEGSDTGKHVGYKRSFPGDKYVLLVVAAEEEDYEGFRLCQWSRVCIEMRRLAVELNREKKVTPAAMVLAFAATVEQNLLGFSANSVRNICSGHSGFFSTKIVDHIQKFLDPVED